jgi:putative chitinase
MRFKGRGYIQITGRKNYQDYASSKFCVGNLMAHPEWLTKSPGRVKASLYFWWKNGLNALADKDDILAVTKRINGGYNGLAARKVYTNKAKGALGIKN